MMNLFAVKFNRAFWPILSVFFFISCDQSIPQPPNEDKLLASVGSRTLFASDLSRIIHPNASVHDSIAIATAYIDQWVRDQLMALEATRHLSSDLDIEKLVEDYREKLLKFNLEEQIIDARFDTIIAESELNSFYNLMKEQFYLKDDIYRCIFARFNRGAPGLDTFKKDWKEDNMTPVINFASAFGEESKLDTSVWYFRTDIISWSERLSDGLNRQKEKVNIRDSKYEYFLKIIEKVDKAAVSPLDYIRPQLMRMLLHKRKQSILEDYKQELYESALDKNLIKLQ